MKWGFIGYGNIAHKFEESLKHTDHQIVAIASKSGYQQVASPIHAYKSYEALIADDEVEILYVSTPHHLHAKLTIDALNAGKHVLCEKPMSTSAESTRLMIDAARKNNRFLMEGVWSRFLPGYQKALGMIHKGAIGEVSMISAHFGFRMNPDAPKERLIDPLLAAGAIWDVGIYPISLVQDIYKTSPMKYDVTANLSVLGVEDRCAAQYTYHNGKIAQITCAIDIATPNKALITGSKGYIIMDDFWKCERFLIKSTTETCIYEVPMTSTGLYHEAVAVDSYIKQGLLQSPIMTWNHSLQLAEIMDQTIALARLKVGA